MRKPTFSGVKPINPRSFWLGVGATFVLTGAIVGAWIAAGCGVFLILMWAWREESSND